MIFHAADDSHEISYLIFCRKLGKMSRNLSSAAVVIGALRVKRLLHSLSLSRVLKVLLMKDQILSYAWKLNRLTSCFESMMVQLPTSTICYIPTRYCVNLGAPRVHATLDLNTHDSS